VLLVLSALAIVASILLGLALFGNRAGPPPAQRVDGVVDWTRQWRKALDSLDRPLPPRALTRRPHAADGRTLHGSELPGELSAPTHGSSDTLARTQHFTVYKGSD